MTNMASPHWPVPIVAKNCLAAANQTSSVVNPFTVTIATVECILMVFIILLNGLILAAFARSPRIRRNVTNYYLMQLAAADFICGLLVGMHLAFLLNPHVLCTDFGCLARFCSMMTICGVSAFSHFAITYDRFVAIVLPLRYRSRSGRRVVWQCLVIDTLPILLFVAVPMLWKDSMEGREQCTVVAILPRPYLAYIVIPLYLLVTFTKVSLYLTILHTCLTRLRRFGRFSPGGSNSRQRQSIYQTNVKLAKTGSLVLGIFIACWLPYFVILMMQVYGSASSDMLPWIHLVTFLLILLQSALNPIIYFHRVPAFRAEVRDMLGGGKQQEGGTSVRGEGGRGREMESLRVEAAIGRGVDSSPGRGYTLRNGQGPVLSETEGAGILGGRARGDRGTLEGGRKAVVVVVGEEMYLARQKANHKDDIPDNDMISNTEGHTQIVKNTLIVKTPPPGGVTEAPPSLCRESSIKGASCETTCHRDSILNGGNPSPGSKNQNTSERLSVHNADRSTSRNPGNHGSSITTQSQCQKQLANSQGSPGICAMQYCEEPGLSVSYREPVDITGGAEESYCELCRFGLTLSHQRGHVSPTLRHRFPRKHKTKENHTRHKHHRPVGVTASSICHLDREDRDSYMDEDSGKCNSFKTPTEPITSSDTFSNCNGPITKGDAFSAINQPIKEEDISLTCSWPITESHKHNGPITAADTISTCNSKLAANGTSTQCDESFRHKDAPTHINGNTVICDTISCASNLHGPIIKLDTYSDLNVLISGGGLLEESEVSMNSDITMPFLNGLNRDSCEQSSCTQSFKAADSGVSCDTEVLSSQAESVHKASSVMYNRLWDIDGFQ